MRLEQQTPVQIELPIGDTWLPPLCTILHPRSKRRVGLILGYSCQHVWSSQILTRNVVADSLKV